jgi:hypothetical protein
LGLPPGFPDTPFLNFAVGFGFAIVVCLLF